MPKGAQEHWIDEPFPETAGAPCLDHPTTIGDGTGSLDDEEAPYAPALIVNGMSVFNFFAKFLGNIRVYGNARVASLLSGVVKIAAEYLQFTQMAAVPALDTLGINSSAANIYVKGGKLVVQVKTSTTDGSVHYWYLDITGTSGTWTYSATEP